MSKILWGLLVIVGVFLIYVGLKPADYMVSREVVITATAKKIFPYLNNSKLVASWSPWAELDPDAKMSFSGPDAGVGSKTIWEGGKKLGTGSATVSESVENQLVRVRLEYQKPFEMVQEAEFELKPVDNQTAVIWRVRGKNTFLGRMMCTFSNMDKMVGGIFEKGLTKLKNLVEKI